MTTTLVRSAGIQIPLATPLDGTLLDVATIHEGLEWIDPIGLDESYNCFQTDNYALQPCPQVFLAAPVQAASGTATSGGTLAAGTYGFVITAINAQGETVKSNRITQTTTGSASTVTLNWAAVTGATGYRIYASAVGGAAGTETYLTSVGAVITYVWTGTPAQVPTNPLPPSNNTAVTQNTKTAASPAWVNGFKFSVYALAVCRAFGDAIDVAALERAFTANESLGVERAVMQTRMIVNGSVWAAATDLTPAGGAVNPDVGLAILEGHAAANYAGVPTIHAPRTIGSLLASRGPGLEKRGRGLYSRLGSKVAAGGGYEYPNNSPTNTNPSAGELWMYASGEVMVARSGLTSEGQMNTINNEQVHLVERTYIASTDCYTAAVRVKVL